MRIERIAIAGAGRVAVHLARIFTEKGLRITALLNRSTEDDLLLPGGGTIPRTTDLSAFAAGAPDLFLLAVSDDAVEEVARSLAGTGIPVAHTSGALSVDVLAGGDRPYGAFYPLQTFTAGHEPDWESIPVCVTADAGVFRDALFDLAGRISRRPVVLEDAERPWLHLSAVLVNNCVNHLLARSRDLLDARGLPEDLLTPLLDETVRRAAEAHPRDVQTGPARRGDRDTREIHRALLHQFGDARLSDLYDYFWRSIESYHHDLPGESPQR